MKYIFSIIFFIGISVAVPVHVLAADIPPASLPVSANKRIDLDLSEQRLRYYHGDYEMGSFLISSGTKWYPTPVGEFAVQKKPIENILILGLGKYFLNACLTL